MSLYDRDAMLNEEVCMRTVLAFLVLKIIYVYITPNVEGSILQEGWKVLMSIAIIFLCVFRDLIGALEAGGKGFGSNQ